MWNKGLCMIYPYLINAWLSLQLELNKSPGHYLRIFLSTYVISASVHSYCAFAKSEFEIFLEILEIQVWDWCNEKQTVWKISVAIQVTEDCLALSSSALRLYLVSESHWGQDRYCKKEE